MKTPRKNVPPLTLEDLTGLIEQIETIPFGHLPLILGFVAERYGVTVRDIQSPERPGSAIPPRREAAVLCRALTTMSYPQIGSAMRRDHTTVLYHFRKAPAHLRELLQTAHHQERAA